MKRIAPVLFMSLHFFLVKSEVQQSENCVPLRSCPSLFFLVKNRDELPDMSRVDVYRYLRDLHCGFSGSDPLIKCSNIDGKTHTDPELSIAS